MGSLEFSKQLLTHAEVAVAPGVGYGEEGEGYVRIALVENEQRIKQALRQIDAALNGKKKHQRPTNKQVKPDESDAVKDAGNSSIIGG